MERPSGQGRLDARTPPGERPRANDLVSRSCELGDVSFGESLRNVTDARIQWATPDGLEIVGWGTAVECSAVGPDRFDTIRSQATATFEDLEYDGPDVARPRAFGGFSFHDAHEPAGPWNGFGAATFVIPAVILTRTDDGTWLTAVGDGRQSTEQSLESWAEHLSIGPAMRPSGQGPGIRETRRTTTREEWIDGVKTAIDRIESRALEKVVLAQALEVDLEGSADVPSIVERLRRRYPNCYRFLVGHEASGTFFGAPPERLVLKQGDHVRTEALAGSVPRGGSPETDGELADSMIESEKVQHEHGVVVDAIRSQLEPLSKRVAIDDQRVRRLATIQHLWTPIEATLENGAHVLDLVEALHPTPAVGGIPPAIAWETIRSIESFDRGWYASPVGWFDGAGDGEFAVGIRSGVATNGTVTLFAGNGIVGDSDPVDEWDEVLLKYRPILDELREP